MADPIEEEIRNFVRLERQSKAVARAARAILRTAVLPELAKGVERYDPSSVGVRYRGGRLEKLLGVMREASRDGFADVRREIEGSLVSIGTEQARWASRLIEAQAGTAETVARKSDMRSAVRAGQMDGLTLREWVDGAEASFVRRATQELRRGVDQVASGEALLTGIRRVSRGTRRHFDAIARTGVTYITNEAHVRTYEANADVLSGVEFVATLDTRTTIVCARWDGTVWPLGSSAIQKPPLHVNCRSQLIPVVDYEGLGLDAPAKGTRASESGQTSHQTYEAWFRAQDAAKQDSIIGPARARLFRRGDITFRDMVTRDNRVRPVARLTP